MNLIDTLTSRRRYIRRRLRAEIAQPVADLALVRRLMRRARQASLALAQVAAA